MRTRKLLADCKASSNELPELTKLEYQHYKQNNESFIKKHDPFGYGKDAFLYSVKTTISDHENEITENEKNVVTLENLSQE